MRVWAVSDVHADYSSNLDWACTLCTASEGGYARDCLIVAGDVSDSLDTLEMTLTLFQGSFKHVFFTPGNHDLWVRGADKGIDSLGKLQRVLELCNRLGVHTQPTCVEGLWVVPLLSWYHDRWDTEPDVPGAQPISHVMMDFALTSWGSQPELRPKGGSLARHFDALNEPAFSAALEAIEQQAAAAGGVRPPVISFSHFLPRQDLLPEKRFLFHPNLAKAAGSGYLEQRIRRLRPIAHVFGHTCAQHFAWDATLGGIRYVQHPRGYPEEQGKERLTGTTTGGDGWQPLLLFDATTGKLGPQQSCYWSEYYSTTPRNPADVAPSPWTSCSYKGKADR